MKWQDLKKSKKDSEKVLEPYLKQEVEKMGGLCLKLVAMQWFGFPDRTILLKPGRIYFVELKSKGETPSKLQNYVHDILRKLGFNVTWIDNMDDLKRYIDNELYGIK